MHYQWRRKTPSFTSRTCSACGHVDAASRQTQAVFVCTKCGHADNADINAAKSILAHGLELAGGRPVSACGDLGAGRSVKQEKESRLQPALRAA